MGQILGGIASAIGGIVSGDAAAHEDENASNAAMTGYNYLTSGAGAAPQSTFVNNGVNASNEQAGTQGAIAGLLGQGPNSDANKQAFNNYLGSTGYQFQLGQGTQAINSNAASRGVLQSGANAKALAGYGQDLASTTFNNYLGQLGGLNAAYGSTAAAGENANVATAQQGTSGGVGSAEALAAAAKAQAGGISNAFGQASSALSSGGLGTIANFFA